MFEPVLEGVLHEVFHDLELVEFEKLNGKQLFFLTGKGVAFEITVESVVNLGKKRAVIAGKVSGPRNRATGGGHLHGVLALSMAPIQGILLPRSRPGVLFVRPPEKQEETFNGGEIELVLKQLDEGEAEFKRSSVDRLLERDTSVSATVLPFSSSLS